MKTEIKLSCACAFAIILVVVTSFVLYERDKIDEFYYEAVNGDAPKETTLGVYYLHGYPVDQNYVKAMEWLRRAADQGYAPAQLYIGQMYRQGIGVQRDVVKAYMWIELSTAQGNQEASEMMPDLINEMTLQQLAEAQSMVAHWRPTIDEQLAHRQQRN